ncbi:hypothetical protein MMC20_001034 [Loxospora ochrophaea]|nr:hypothetical protein [Loxospora ochrophaea]
MCHFYQFYGPCGHILIEETLKDYCPYRERCRPVIHKFDDPGRRCCEICKEDAQEEAQEKEPIAAQLRIPDHERIQSWINSVEVTEEQEQQRERLADYKGESTVRSTLRMDWVGGRVKSAAKWGIDAKEVEKQLKHNRDLNSSNTPLTREELDRQYSQSLKNWEERRRWARGEEGL